MQIILVAKILGVFGFDTTGFFHYRKGADGGLWLIQLLLSLLETHPFEGNGRNAANKRALGHYFDGWGGMHR